MLLHSFAHEIVPESFSHINLTYFKGLRAGYLCVRTAGGASHRH